MLSEKIGRSIFPNVTLAGAYWPLSNVITMDSVDSSTYIEAAGDGDISQKLRVTPLLFHELRHWLDHIGTVWGQRTLRAGCEAMAARKSNNPEEFWRILNFRRRYNSSLLSAYYTTVEDRRPTRAKTDLWRATPSCGLRFDSSGKQNQGSPVLFIQFDWPDGRRACRVPVSVLSLLESGATYFQLACKLGFIASMEPGAREVELADWNRNLVSEAYDPDLGVYSVAAHIIANRVKESDFHTAYKLTAGLSSVCLNLPSDIFNSFRIHDRLRGFGDRALALRSSGDLGFAFMSLAYFGPEDSPGNDEIEDWIDAALANAGLPQLKDLRDIAAAEMELISNGASAGQFQEYLLERLSMGREFYARFGMIPDFWKVLKNRASVPMPPIVLGDQLAMINGALVAVKGSSLGTWIDNCDELDSSMGEFLEVCGM